MWYKVSWLTFWVSMTLWVGNSWGCAAPGEDQNYRAHADGGGLHERENYEHPRDHDKKGIFQIIQDNANAARPESKSNSSVIDRGHEGPVGENGVADASAGTGADAPAVADSSGVPIETKAGSEYADEDLPEETEPSITSLDRSHWQKIKAGANVGITKHNPIYYKDFPADRATPQVDFSQSVEEQLTASLEGASAKQWDWHHSQQVVTQVVKYGFDTIALPVRVVLQHPWTVVETP